MNNHINCPCCNNIIKINSYTEPIKKALKKYRDTHPEVYKKNSKEYYNKNKENPEWRANKNEKQRISRLLRKEKLLKEKELLEKFLNLQKVVLGKTTEILLDFS